MNFIDKNELPKELLRLKNPPQKLFYIGNKELLKLPKIAIVGSRKASVYTRNCVLNLTKILKDAGICVVSGGAIGVDIIAHTAALPNTIAVFANGLDIIYPKTNEKVIREIYKSSLALSEYPQGISPFKKQFLERNRIVVGLCDALVVAQADLMSGSMQSARIAKESGVPLFVLPQRYNESNGTNALLANGDAKIIDDFYKFISWLGLKAKTNENKNDEILEFCKNGVRLDVALAKFKDKIYEYELNGLLDISNLEVKSI